MKTFTSPTAQMLRVFQVAVLFALLGNVFCTDRHQKVRGNNGGKSDNGMDLQSERALETNYLRRKRVFIMVENRGPDKLTTEDVMGAGANSLRLGSVSYTRLLTPSFPTQHEFCLYPRSRKRLLQHGISHSQIIVHFRSHLFPTHRNLVSCVHR